MYTDIDIVKSAWKAAYRRANAEIFDFTMVKPAVRPWVERTIVLPAGTSVYPGPYSYNYTPYWGAVVDHVHPSDPTRTVSVMKIAQGGATQGLVIPAICYLIAENPDNILFTGGDLMLAAKTIEERLDPILRASQLAHLIRPNVIKKTNNRSGDTSKKKEFAGGTLTAVGTNSANSFRFYSAKYVFADDYDTAPRDLGKEGSVKSLIQARQNSYGNKAKTFFISSPTVTQTSNIYEQFLLGTQNKWHWPCPNDKCGAFMCMDWSMVGHDGRLAGIVWELDEEKRLIKDSVHFRCPHCGGRVEEKDKYGLNLLGRWISTVERPVEEFHESYHLGGVVLPPGFTNWTTMVEEWLLACPPGGRVNVELLKSFNNVRLGLPFAEIGESPRVAELMQNTRAYHPGIVPDVTCERDGNGKIIMLTLACDLNGVMDSGNEDVRLDWELLAHASTGATYSVDHGSIGTFKRTRDRSTEDKRLDIDRDKWTLTHDVRPNRQTGLGGSVWPEFEAIMKKEYLLESRIKNQELRETTGAVDDGHINTMVVNITVVDTGFGEKLATLFIKNMQAQGLFCYGVKGRTEDNYRKLQRDTNPVKRSVERPELLYIAEVNQIKDDLSALMKLREGDDGSQPGGFMNFPEPRDDKYTMKNYFSHYESEHRTEVKKNGQVIGFMWKKKNNQVANHFWDVRIYGLIAPLIYIDLLKKSDPAKFKNFTWEDLVYMYGG